MYSWQLCHIWVLIYAQYIWWQIYSTSPTVTRHVTINMQLITTYTSISQNISFYCANLENINWNNFSSHSERPCPYQPGDENRPVTSDPKCTCNDLEMNCEGLGLTAIPDMSHEAKTQLYVDLMNTVHSYIHMLLVLCSHFKIYNSIYLSL